MNKKFLTRYFWYLIRWQLSTPILALVIIYFTWFDPTTKTIIANLIGGLIFFWIDKYVIFREGSPFSVWEIKERINCADCGKEARGYRLVKSKKYDKTDDKKPEYRCESCSKQKSEKLREVGVEH